MRVTALAQAAQGDGRVPIFRHIQQLPGHGPGQPVLHDPALAGGLDKKTSVSPFSSQPLCDRDYAGFMDQQQRDIHVGQNMQTFK